MEGYIKLHRKILESPVVMKTNDHFAVWMFLLLNATHKGYDVLYEGKRKTLQPGQLITGRKVISKAFKDVGDNQLKKRQGLMDKKIKNDDKKKYSD